MYHWCSVDFYANIRELLCFRIVAQSREEDFVIETVNPVPKLDMRMQ